MSIRQLLRRTAKCAFIVHGACNAAAGVRCVGVDIRRDGLPAVLRRDGSQLVLVSVHGDGAGR